MPPLPPERRSRFLEGAHLRRLVVYVITAVVVIYAAYTAVEWARPPDVVDRITVERLNGYYGRDSDSPTEVKIDPATGHTYVEVDTGEGAARRYRVERDDQGWRVYDDN